MTNRTKAILAACLALAGPGCGVQTGGNLDLDPRPAAGSPKPAATTPALTWAEYAPPGGGFSILMPGQPEVGVTKEPSGDGKELEHHNFSLVTKPNAYIVDYLDMDFDLPAEGRAPFYDAMRDGNLEARKAKLVEEKEMTVDGVVGRDRVDEMDTKMGPFVMKTRSFLAGRRFYTVIASAPKAILKGEEADKFLHSFHITKPAETKEPK